MKETIITTIFTLCGVIIGAFLTFVSTYLLEMSREKREMKKHLRHNAVKMTQYIKNIQFTCQTITKILNNNFIENEDEFINETKKCLYSNVARTYPILPEFNTILFEYLTKLTNDKLYKSYEKAITTIESLYYDTQPTSIQIDEVTRNMLTELQKTKKYFTDANEFLIKVENEFISLVKKR